MADFYADLAQTGLELVDEFGRDVQHAPNGTTDIVSGQSWRGQQPIAPTTIRAAIFEATSLDRQSFPAIEFSKTAIIAAKDIVNIPEVEDRLIDDLNYRVVRVVETKPGPVALLYTLLLSASPS